VLGLRPFVAQLRFWRSDKTVNWTDGEQRDLKLGYCSGIVEICEDKTEGSRHAPQKDAFCKRILFAATTVSHELLEKQTCERGANNSESVVLTDFRLRVFSAVFLQIFFLTTGNLVGYSECNKFWPYRISTTMFCERLKDKFGN
jgi:hypothetical protein